MVHKAQLYAIKIHCSQVNDTNDMPVHSIDDDFTDKMIHIARPLSRQLSGTFHLFVADFDKGVRSVKHDWKSFSFGCSLQENQVPAGQGVRPCGGSDAWIPSINLSSA